MGLFALAAASLAGATDARAQASDMISQKLGLTTKPVPAPRKGEKTPVVDLRVRLTMRAGQSYLLKDGVSALPQAVNDTDTVQFQLLQPAGCGTTKVTKSGVLLTATPDCVGKSLTPVYETSWKELPDSKAKVSVEMFVNRGMETCGLPNFPFEMLRVPGGVYSLQKPPSTVTDIVKLSSASEIKVPGFCISEDLVPVGEVEAYLAGLEPQQLTSDYPEMEQAASKQALAAEGGRGSSVPATGTSHRVSVAVAKALTARHGRQFQLPSLEHYIAAALHFQKAKSGSKDDGGATFLVSLRSGLFEWTSEACGVNKENFGALGIHQQTGEMVMYCYAPARKLQLIGLRVIAIQ